MSGLCVSVPFPPNEYLLIPLVKVAVCHLLFLMGYSL